MDCHYIFHHKYHTLSLHFSPIHIHFRTVTFVYKTLNGFTPLYMLDLFKLQTDVSTRVTRFNQKNKLYVPKYKLSVSRRSLSYNGSVQFNQLPCDTKERPSLKPFKCKAFKHFMQSV